MMYARLTLVTMLALVNFMYGCATGSTLPDGSVDREIIPIRAMSGMPLVEVLPDGRRIYYHHVEKENSRCFIVMRPNGRAAYFFSGNSTRQHWVCVLKPPGQPHWVIVDYDDQLKEINRHPYKYNSEREAYIIGKQIIYQ